MHDLSLEYLCEFCINGQVAINQIKEHLDNSLYDSANDNLTSIKPISLLLLDFQMPIKNGIQVVQEVRAYYQLRQKENT